MRYTGSIGTAHAIFHSIEDKRWTDEEKAGAIYDICQMETHNSVTKAAMLKVIWWLLHRAFDFHNEKETEENENA